MTANLRLIEEHNVTNFNIEKTTSICKILKEMYPKSVIKIIVYKQLHTELFDNQKQNQKQKNIRKQQKAQVMHSSFVKHENKKVNGNNFLKNSHLQTQFTDQDSIKRKKRNIVSGFIQTELSAQQDLVVQQTLQIQPSQQQSQENVIAARSSTYKKFQTLCRFYGTETAIFSRKSTKQSNQSQQEIHYQKRDKNVFKYKNLIQNFSNQNEVICLKAETEDLYEGLVEYSNKNYHEAIKIFDQMFCQFINFTISGDSQKNINQIICTDLSFYQRRVLASLTFHLGNCYFRIQQFDKSLFFYEIDESIIYQQKQQKAQRYNNMGSCYVKIGKQHMSLKYYQKSLKLYDQYPNVDKSNLMYNIGNMYLNFGMYKEANQYFKLSIQERKLKSSHKQQMLCKTYFYLAISQRHQGKLDSSIGSFILGKQVAQTQNISRNLYEKILYQMAVTYQLFKNYRKSLNLYEKIVEEINKNGENRIQLGQIYQKVAFIFKRLNNQEKYIYFKKKSLQEYRSKIKEEKQNQKIMHKEKNQVIKKEKTINSKNE